MAEKQSAMTPARETGRPLATRPVGTGMSPFRTFRRLTDEMDRLFEDFAFGGRWPLQAFRDWPSSMGRETELEGWNPDIEVYQKDNQLNIKVDLPGLTRDEVSVEIGDDAVTIQGERKREHEEEREGMHRSERSYGFFRRVIPLPEGAITEQARANLHDGVLEIAMPAPPAGKSRRLEITEGTKK